MNAAYARAQKFNALATELAATRSTVTDALEILATCTRQCDHVTEAASVLRATLPEYELACVAVAGRRLHSV